MLKQIILTQRFVMTTTSLSPSDEVPAEPPVLHRKFVRVTSPEGSEFVQFEFAIGWPDLSAELTLRRDQFEEFCEKQQVEFLEPGDARPISLHDIGNKEVP